MILRRGPTKSRRFLISAALLLSWSFAQLLGGADLTTAQPKATRYAVQGVFLESRSAGRVAVIAHEEVPGYMQAMTMPFNVKTPAELKGLRPGDPIVFQLFVTDTDDWIEQIKKAKRRAGKATPPGQPLPAVHELKSGDPAPDCVLTNQAGQVLHLADFKGQALALTFFFSRCPLPTFCPRMNNNFEIVQQRLQTQERTNWHLLSISFDPAADTPERLRDFAGLHHSDPRHWSFATSSQEEIRRLGSAFGLTFWRESGSFSHNLRTVVLDASGRVRKILAGNEWQPADLIAEMQKAMVAQPH